ncbi:MAG: NnrS family protein [Wenzhouxiangellaceae bacterium]
MSRFQMLFNYGFRIFFLSAALYAVALMILWLGNLTQGWPVAGVWPLAWHAHEMVHGLVAAAIAGFLLTAVPNWTGTGRLHGRGLCLLWLLWLSGRLGFGFLDPYTNSAAAWIAWLVDLAFLPALAATIAVPLIRTGNRRNAVMILLLIALATTNLLHGLPASNAAATRFALDLVTVLMAVIGGRITPAFTRNWLIRNQIAGPLPHSHPWLDRAAIASLVLVAITSLVVPHAPVLGWLCGLAGGLHLWRLAAWRGWRAASDPLLWVLHLGYAWIIVGLCLRAAGILTDAVPVTAWYHAIGAGAMATLILGVMARVALGHTGRELRLQAGGIWIFVLITAAALARVVMALGIGSGGLLLWVAGLCWIGAFTLYLALYIPILSAPRVDGRPG